MRFDSVRRYGLWAGVALVGTLSACTDDVGGTDNADEMDDGIGTFGETADDQTEMSDEIGTEDSDSDADNDGTDGPSCADEEIECGEECCAAEQVCFEGACADDCPACDPCTVRLESKARALKEQARAECDCAVAPGPDACFQRGSCGCYCTRRAEFMEACPQVFAEADGE